MKKRTRSLLLSFFLCLALLVSCGTSSDICPKTHDWHNNQCRECQNNLINEFRTGTDYRQGGLFFYCAYPRIIHEADKYGEVHLPSIRF